MPRRLPLTLVLGISLIAIVGWLTLRQGEPTAPNNPSIIGDVGVYQTTCATCHGEKGEGSREQMAPSIASHPRWYLEEQIRKFRSGQRGKHPQDPNGQKMRAAISTLTEEQIKEAIDHLLTLPMVKSKPTLSGNAEAGKELYYENCMACHRYNGSGEVVFKSAPLTGLQDWYLLAQLEKFQKGIRGYDPHDESGIKMRKSVSHLSNKQEMIDILALISTFEKKGK